MTTKPTGLAAAVMVLALLAAQLVSGAGTVVAQALSITVHSAAMGRDIPVRILHTAAGKPAGTLYLLNGAGGGEDSANWFDQGNAEAFFRGKNVNVVVPMAGAFSYYTDWERDDPMLGRNKWETFLTRELPPVVAATVATNGRNAVAGLSMSGSAALVLAERHPDFYVGVASYSGCPATSDPVGSAYVRLTVEVRGAGDVTRMWGPIGGPGWRAHDALLGAHKLRGKYVFVSAGSGLPGRYDNTSSPQKMQQILVGGPIEAAVAECSGRFLRHMNDLRLPVSAYFPATGSHSFAYWNDALAHSWPGMARALGVR